MPQCWRVIRSKHGDPNMTNKKKLDSFKYPTAFPRIFSPEVSGMKVPRRLLQQGLTASKLIGHYEHVTRLTKLMAPRMAMIDEFQRANAWPQQLNKIIGTADKYHAATKQLTGHLTGIANFSTPLHWTGSKTVACSTWRDASSSSKRVAKTVGFLILRSIAGWRTVGLTRIRTTFSVTSGVALQVN